MSDSLPKPTPRRGRRKSAFTLIEMLVVISIIVLLASLLFPAINSALRRAQQARCMSSLRNFGIAWNTQYLEVISGPHSNEMEAVFPWLSAMVPEYIEATVLRCPGDKSKGRYGSKPEEDPVFAAVDRNGFPETDDTLDNNHSLRNRDVEVCSYMYEFSAAECDWWNGYILNSKGTVASTSDIDLDPDDGGITWGEVKLAQLAYGDTSSPGAYDRTQFPLVRCFHHFDDKEVKVQNTDDNRIETNFRVLNLAMDNHVFVSGLKWEYPLAP